MPQTLSPDARRERVLVVDDDPIFTGLSSAALERAGFDVCTAADGVEGLELLDREPFDLAIVDLLMPRIDGFRLIALIRGSARLAPLAILVVSVRNDAGAFEEALALGADAIQTKPLDWFALPDIARAVIDDKRTVASHLAAG